MREKKLWALASFRTTAAAIAMEQACARENVPGRLIPVPTSITADCGMAWRCAPDARGASAAAAERAGAEIDRWYELLL